MTPDIPKGNQEVVNHFWEALISAGREVLAQGLRLGYGFSVVEIKYSNGNPTVMIRSHTQNRKYKSSEQALADINDIVLRTRSAGSQTFTIVREVTGEISRVMLDEYLNERF